MALSISLLAISPNSSKVGQTLDVTCTCAVVDTAPPTDVRASYSVDPGLQIVGQSSFAHSLKKTSNVFSDKIRISALQQGLVKVSVTICKSGTNVCDSAQAFLVVGGVSIHSILAFTDESGDSLVSSKWAAYRYLKEKGFSYNSSLKIWEQ